MAKAEGLSPLSPSLSHTGTRVEESALPRLLGILSPVVHSWSLFAVLIGVPSSQISAIEAANPRRSSSCLYNCFLQSLEWWVANHDDPTYEAILAVLDPKRGETTPLMNRDLAKQVKQFMAKEQVAMSPTAAAGTLIASPDLQGNLGEIYIPDFLSIHLYTFNVANGGWPIMMSQAILTVLDPKWDETTPLMNRVLAKKVKEFMAKEQGSTTNFGTAFEQRNDSQIRGKFAVLLEFVREKLQRRFQDTAEIYKLRRFILDIFPHISEGCISSDIQKIFEALRSNRLLTYMNYFPLEEIIKHFGDSDMTSKMEIYKGHLKAFKLAIKIKEYVPEFRSEFGYDYDKFATEIRPNTAPDYLDRLTIKLEEHVGELHLEYIDELWTSVSCILSLPPLALLLDTIIMNSILVVWLVPSNLVPKAIERAQQSAGFFRKHPILKVTIGKDCVYQAEGTKEEGISTKEMEEKIGESVELQQEPMPAQHEDFERGGYDCEFVKRPPKDLDSHCPICLQVLREPQLISCCGIHFCWSCIEPVQRQGESCPHCKMEGFTLMHDSGLARKLNALKVRCVQNDKGNVCGWTGELRQLDRHLHLLHPNVLTKRRPTSLNRKGVEEPPLLKPNDFHWDRIVNILAIIMLGLLAVVGMEMFQGSGVQCTVPASVETSNCHQSLSRGILIFISAHALAIIVSQYLWTSFLFGHSKFFFDMTNQLNVSQTGESDAWAFEIIKKLEKEYKTRRLVYTYILKLGFQFVVTLFSFIFGVTYYYSFSPSFTCSNLSIEATSDGWPLNSTVTCVYSSSNFIPFIQYVDCALVGMAAITTLIGLVWYFLRHPLELGYQSVAMFVVDSCFLPEHYVSKPFFHCPRQPHVENDLDFLLLVLFHTNAQRGKAFKMIQIQNEVTIHSKKNQELLQLFRTAQSEIGAIDKRMPDPRRIHDVHMYFRDRGFKGTPRHNVFRLFSSQFGITEQKACDVPLDEGELKKIAEELAYFGEREKVILLMEKLGCPDVHKQLSHRELNVSKLHQLLCEWLDSQKGTAVNESSSTTESGAHQVLPPRKRMAGALKDSDSPQLKLTGNGVYYGYLRKEPELEDEFLNRLLGFIQFAPGNTFAMNISFGSSGCPSILAWGFQEVASVNFDQHLHDPEEWTIETSYSNVTTLRFPPDVFVRKIDDVLKFGEAINTVFYGEGEVGVYNKQKDIRRVRTDFIVVGPIDDDSKRTTVNRLIDRLHQDSLIHDEAVLLALRPLKIEDKVTLKQFVSYLPPQALFKRICVHNDQGHQTLEHQIGRESIHILTVNEDEGKITTEEKFNIRGPIEGDAVSNKESRIEGISATCGDVACLFEFAVYRYVHVTEKTVQGRDSRRPPKDRKSPKQPKSLTMVLTLKDSSSRSDSSTNTADEPDTGRQSSLENLKQESVNDDDNQSHVSAPSDESTQTQQQLVEEDDHESKHKETEDEYWFMKVQSGTPVASPTHTSSQGITVLLPETGSSANASELEQADDIPIEDASTHDIGRQLSEIDSRRSEPASDDDSASTQSDESNTSMHVVKDEMTAEEEYWFMRAQGGIPADGHEPASHPPTEYSSDDEPDETVH